MSETKQAEAEAELESEAPESRRSGLKWAGIGIALLALAPSLMTVSGKHASVLRFMHPKLAEAMKYQSISCHWWSPVVIQDIEVQDLSTYGLAVEEDRISLAQIQSISSVQPLWKLVLSRGDGAEFRIRQPVINVTIQDGQTNVEETMNRIFGVADEPGQSSRLSVTIEDGTIRLITQSVDEQFDVRQITGIHGKLSTLKQTPLPEIALVADVGSVSVDELADAENRRFRRTQIAANLNEIAADFPLQPFEGELDRGEGDTAQPALKIKLGSADSTDTQELSIEARKLNCAELEPVVRRFFPDASCRGIVSCRIQAQVIGGKAMTGFAGRIQLAGQEIRLRNSTWAAGESLDLDQLTVSGVMAFAEDGILLDQMRVQSEIVNLSGDGDVKYQRPDPVDAIRQSADNENRQAAAEAAAASHGQVRLRGNVDMAALSRMLPQTLGVSSGVELRTADVQFSGQIQQDVRPSTDALDLGATPQGFEWRLAVQSSSVEAYRGNQRIVVDSVFRVDALGGMELDSLDLSKAQLSGEFGQLTADSIENGYSVSGLVNPEILWNDFRQILDVPRPQIAGQVKVNGQIRNQGNTIQLADLSLTSTGLEVTSQQLAIHSDRPLTEMFDGTIDVRGEAAALKTVISPWHDAWWLARRSTVAARLAANPGRQMNVQVVVRDQGAVGSDAFQIDSGRLEASLVADRQTGGFLVETGKVELPGLVSDVSGTLGVRENLIHVNLTADTRYDLPLLSRRVLRLSDSILLEGQGREVFRIAGSPSLITTTDLLKHQRTIYNDEENARQAELLHADGAVAWDGGVLYGAQLGAASVAVQLENGVLRTAPISCMLGEGQLDVMPQLTLESNLLQIAPGGRIQGLRLTPALTHEWLGFVAPMLADAAQIDGLVSARVQQFEYYLDQPQQSTVNGVLSIHRASAAPGNSLGPVIQVLTMLGRDKAATRRLEFPSQEVPVQLRDGIVSHRDLMLDVNGYQIGSSGQVGLDEQVNLVLDVSLDKSGNGRRVQIPVRGSVSRPVPDTAGLLQNLGRQEIEKRVNDKLNDEINRGLQGLFDKIR